MRCCILKTQYTHLYRPIKNRDIMKCIADRLHITEDENAEHKDISDISDYIENEDKIKTKRIYGMMLNWIMKLMLTNENIFCL